MIPYIAVVVVLVAILVAHFRAEARKDRAWLHHMHELARRCPSCGGIGLVVETPFGRDPMCHLCDGTGKIE